MDKRIKFTENTYTTNDSVYAKYHRRERINKPKNSFTTNDSVIMKFHIDKKNYRTRKSTEFEWFIRGKILTKPKESHTVKYSLDENDSPSVKFQWQKRIIQVKTSSYRNDSYGLKYQLYEKNHGT